MMENYIDGSTKTVSMNTDDEDEGLVSVSKCLGTLYEE